MYYVSENLKIEFAKAKKLLMEASKICMISHRSPDGDAIGSNLGLRLALENLGKEVTSAAVDMVPENSRYLLKADEFVTDFNYEDFDLIVSVDCGAKKLVKFHENKPELFSGEKPFINIDHHESNDFFGTVNIVDPSSCAASMIIFKFLKFCGWQITIDMATALLHGIYFDTGNLMHSNTTAEVYSVCAELMSKGADVKRASKELFHTTPVNRLRLWGRILERAYINEDNVTVSAVSRSDYAACNVDSKDTSGIIDFLNSVPESKYCVLLSEDEHGLVKGSLRTRRDDVNLSEIASQWGGGGHPKASGFGIEGRLQPVMTWKVVKEGEEGAHEVEF